MAGLIGKLFSKLLGGARTTQEHVHITRDTHVSVTDRDTGETVTYDSLDDAPPEVRRQLEELRHSPDAFEHSQTYTFEDETGVRRTYHSLDEMPPEIRAMFDRAHRGEL